ncbi:hypothetical protein ISS21_01555 [Patescibacteria group bacterium]|nr:hypothetical protein [Patescibacteria group bacterium]
MSLVITLTRFIVLDIIQSILYFPLWWYTSGLKKRFLGFIHGVGNLAHNLALKILLTHVFKPMFGERSRTGRIISFFMRLILLSWRSFLFLLGTIGLLLLLILWVVLPIVAVWQIIGLLF